MRLGLRDGRLATGSNLQPANQPILFGVVTPTRGVIQAGPAEIPVNPGLTWITVPPTPGTVLQVSSGGNAIRPQIVAARLVPTGATPTATVEHIPRHVISVDVSARDGAITGAIITANPTGAGGSVGMAYAESPRNARPPLPRLLVKRRPHHRARPTDRLSLRPGTTRTLTETVDAQPRPPRVARDTQLSGDYRLRLLLSRGLIHDLAILLMDYRLHDGALSSPQPFRQAYVFDMPIRPLPDWS